MTLEIFFILVFLILNGFFAASEIAVVTARKSFVKQLLEKGSHRAATLLKLQAEPDRLLATVQIGVTVMGSIASAIGGAASIKMLKPALANIPFLASFAEPLSLAITVLVISYFTLIIGELVPKSIALRNPERVGLFVAGPISFISRISSVFVTILTESTNLILSPFGTKAYSERSFISEEEIKLLIEEGKDRGIFEPTEQELIHSVFRFTDISVKGVIVPSPQMVAFNINDSPETIIRKIAEENFSRYPVYDKDRSDIKGILYSKDVFNALAYKREIRIADLLHFALFVPESMKISTLMRDMQKKRLHMGIVVDEYGAVSGLVTIEDLLEEIVGEIRDEYDTETPVQLLKSGSMLIDASLAIRDLNEDYHFDIPESNEYDTLGGFLLTGFQKFPSVGDSLNTDSRKFTIVNMKGRRILKVRADSKPEA
ncbi:CBS domain protein [Candidatus Sulfobium mesophilum]|uniref:CBS domain protein n=1 Tax=Candidatus Sulfobium mesophilum TaxID=2016548 RepID=A0A2U3QIB2_9BACT|nr:CBS domain protein [Candidatus Sulfobium mesophilum]